MLKATVAVPKAEGELGAARPTWAPGSRRGRAVRSARGRRSPVCREHGVARSPSPPSPARHPLAPHHPWGAPLVRSPVLGALGFLEGGRPASGFPRGWKQPVGRAPSSVAVAAPTETSSTLPRPPGGHEANAAACASKFPLPLPAQSWGAERAWGARRGHHRVTGSSSPSNRAQSRLAVTAEETRKTLARASWGSSAKYRRVHVFRVAAETRRSRPATPPVPAGASSGAKPRRGPAPCIRLPLRAVFTEGSRLGCGARLAPQLETWRERLGINIARKQFFYPNLRITGWVTFKLFVLFVHK